MQPRTKAERKKKKEIRLKEKNAKKRAKTINDERLKQFKRDEQGRPNEEQEEDDGMGMRDLAVHSSSSNCSSLRLLLVIVLSCERTLP